MSDSTLVAGIDSSTQSVKILLVDAADGTVVDESSAPHPGGSEVDPAAWWTALQAADTGLLRRAAAIGVAGQQHGMVCLDEAGAVVRPALLWNDLRSAGEISAVVEHLGGPQRCADAIGSVPAASFTVTKLRWLAGHEPDAAARTATVALPHDWLTWQLAGAPAGGVTTDHGDASGTGYYSPADRAWRPDVAEWALGHTPALPRLADPGAVVGETSWGATLSAGTGDNMGAALALGLGPGDVAVSIGTSGTAFCVTDTPAADPSGEVAGFADATGRYLPLVCTVNASRILSVVAGLLGVDFDGLTELALAGTPGSHGLTLLPYLDGERTPNRPDATGVLSGITSATTREDLARAAVEALLCSLADAVDALGVTPRRLVMIGGGARNAAVQQLAPGIFGTAVEIPAPGEYVALGAARQAAWALTGTLPEWPVIGGRRVEGAGAPDVRQQYGRLRESLA